MFLENVFDPKAPCFFGIGLCAGLFVDFPDAIPDGTQAVCIFSRGTTRP